ncbi:ABC transporter ATP-binding protein [Protaetiibacter mangrovi]|uniref:ABC transporter ATP-binding protein/permease n=1 Tax=Protaetiibacter mangrovi TaxID=2970926 RepID=A0ABT1ZDF1_9MICO|nr:ABC transporter ATP-binding protein [Protaetiibacter mangrovi]MCS0498733.1 ABC transporter ATP-binding protein/permease [Protaetiibacter mangrovi]
MSDQSIPPSSSPGTVRTLLRILPFVRPFLGRTIVSFVVYVVLVLVQLAVPVVLQWIVDGPLATGDARQIWPAAGLVLALGVAEGLLIMLRRFLVLTPSTHIEASMRNTLYAKLQDLPVAFHDRWQSGQLLSRAMGDLGTIRRWLAFGVILLVGNVVVIVVGFGILFTWSWQLALVFIVASVPMWVVGFRFEHRYSLVSRRAQDQQGDLATTVEESVHGIRVLKAFGRGKHSLEAFLRQAEELRGTELEKARSIAGLWLWLLLIPDTAFALSLLGGVVLAASGQLTVGGLIAFFAAASVLRWPIESIGWLLSMTFETRTAVERLFEVLDEPNPIRDPEHPVTVAEPRGRLVFEHVHFRYQDSPASVPDLLEDITLEVEPGETMALVGLTGSGKTTLTALTTRLYDVTGGRVLIDGVDVRDLTREELRARIAMAFEEATLFSASVRENVLLGRPELDVDSPEGEAVLAEALDIAQAEFVERLPMGADTTIGEEGLSLSGGQRQRIALARAVAARPSVLVLDDPLSALDVDTEARVEAGLRRVLADTTALVVAHRPSTVMLADRVALLEDGRITDVGRHSELLERNPHYRHVISSLDDDRDTEQAPQEVIA